MIAPYKINYDGLSSLDMDFFTELSFDGDSGNVNTFLTRENVETVHYDGRKTIHRAKYNESLEISITFIKNNYGDIDDESNRRFLAWVTANDKPGWLDIYKDDSEVVAYRVFGNWTSIEQYKLANSRVVGYICTFTSSHPYAFSPKLTYPVVRAEGEINNDESNDYAVVQGSSDLTITCNTDEYNKPIYPKITVKFNDLDIFFDVDEDLSQTYSTYDMIPHTVYRDSNEALYVSLNIGEHQGKYPIDEASADATGPMSDFPYYYVDGYIKKRVGEATDGDAVYRWETIVKVGASVKINDAILTGASKNEQITIDGENKLIYSADSSQSIFIGDNFNWIWPSLTYGENHITVTGNCNIKFEWLESRKVGSL